MAETGKSIGRANALDRELVVTSTRSGSAPAQAVWDVLDDLRTHLVWGGEQHRKGRITAIDAPEGAAGVGTEFTSTGEDKTCRMRDRSVVTEAIEPRSFEFVTDSAMELKKGGARLDWTVVHRYEIEPTASGSTVRLETRVMRASALPGALAVFKIPVLRWFALREFQKQQSEGVRNLVRMAEQRAQAG